MFQTKENEWDKDEYEYVAFVCTIRSFGQSASINLMHVFMVVRWWVTVDFNSQYQILWGETGSHGLPIHEEKQSSKQESALLFPPPITSD